MPSGSASAIAASERTTATWAFRAVSLSLFGSALRGMFAKRPFREPHLYAVGRMRAQNFHDTFVGFRARPILLEFEQVLAGRNRDPASLDCAIHRAVMRLHRQIATSIGCNIDFVAFLEHVERRKHHAGFGPQTGDDEFFPPGCGDRLTEACI